MLSDQGTVRADEAPVHPLAFYAKANRQKQNTISLEVLLLSFLFQWWWPRPGGRAGPAASKC